MNDPIRVDHAMHDFGPKPKRIKVEMSRVGNIGHGNFSTPYGTANGQSPQFNGFSNGLPFIPRPLGSVDDTPLSGFSGQTTQTPPSAATHGSPQMTMPARSRPPTIYAPNLGNFEQASIRPQSQITPNQYQVDLSTAPTDTVELVWWLRQQMEHIASNPEAAYSSDPHQQPSGPNTPQSASALPQVAYHEADAEAERERLRQENRLRKQRWRQDNQERNKDNDLRCRVNKIAKNRFGAEETPEKSVFIETEFAMRRAKREQKQKNRAQQSGNLPTFNSANGSAGDVNGAYPNTVDPAVAATGHALMNISRGAEYGNREIAGAELEAAKKVQADIDSGALNNEQFVRATRLAVHAQRNPDYCSASLAGLDPRKEAEDGRSSSGGEEGLRFAAPRLSNMSTTPLLATSGRFPHPYAQSPTATATAFGDMVINKSYASPYGILEAPNLSSAAVTESTSNAKTPAQTTFEPIRRQDSEELPITPAKSTADADDQQVDALLTLAAISDDDDDDNQTIEDQPEQQEKRGGSRVRGGKGKRKAMSAARRKGLRNGISKAKDTAPPAAADPYHEAAHEEDGATDLLRRYAESDLAVNTIVPVKKAQATSKMYEEISRLSRSRSSSPIFSSMPNGSPAAKNKTVNGHLYQNLNGAASSSSLNRGSDEEQMKIRRYGYPPLPGMNGKVHSD